MAILLTFKKKISSIIFQICPVFKVRRFIQKMQVGHVEMYGGYDAYSHIMENCEYFLKKEKLENKSYMDEVFYDIVYCYLKYGTNANEYFCYNFPKRTSKERATYLPRKRKDDLLIKNMGKNWNIYFDQIKDKYCFYKIAKDFFCRDACEIAAPSDYESFIFFMNKHKKVIAKPSRGGCGSGIIILDLLSFENNTEKAFNHLLSFNTPFILEEIVEQDTRIAQWNASSLNTLRIPSFRTAKGNRIIYPSIRIGRSGSIVDNAGSGGTFAAIDPQTGKIITKGYDKRGNSFDKHPDSQITYIGMQIPKWDELLVFVRKMHESMAKEHKYLAFDLALSTKGWVVIEANWGEMSMPQIEFGKGLYKEFEDCLFS
jgi:hypothetical protein